MVIMKKTSIWKLLYLLENNSNPMATTLYIHVQVIQFLGQAVIRRIYKHVVI